MIDDFPADYLAALPADQRAELARVNAPGLAALRDHLSSGEAVAFLGAGVSAPLYPLPANLIIDLVNAASDRLTEQEVATCRALARESPEEVVEIVRRSLGTGAYREVLREVLRVRTDPLSGRSWTPAHELVCRCAFKAVVTTNYDPGIVDARMRVRPGASETGFITWEDEPGLDRWRTGDVFGEAELPVLFAHGQHNRLDSVVLVTAEYRRAYAGKLPLVLGRLVDAGHLVWIGFSFADQRIAAILREIADKSGPTVHPGAPPQHIAVMAWDPAAEGNDPGILARRAEIGYGAQVVLYPAPRGDHSALVVLLSALTDPKCPPAGALPVRDEQVMPARDRNASGDSLGLPVTWVPGAERVEHFTGRMEELARLARWAADPQVSLVGVTAWGGAGKTMLVNHWIQEGGAASRRRAFQGVFGWSFYTDPSVEHWADALLEWGRQELGIQVTRTDRLATAVLAVLRAVPLLLVLDGLEVVQEGPAGDGFGRLMDGTLREILFGACQQRHSGLLALTSRFPFTDLDSFDGTTARILDVPPFTPAEGTALLAAAGGAWLADADRRALVQAVDGHPLAVGVLAGLLADRPPASDIDALRDELAAVARTSTRVGRMLEFYANRLNEADRYLLAAVSLFPRPVPAAAVLTVARHPAFADHLAGWTPTMVEAAVRDRLGGLISWHQDGTLSVHPLIRDTFRPLALEAAGAAADAVLTGIPAGEVTSRADALRVIEAIELLLDAGQWQPADDLYRGHIGSGDVWKRLGMARLGQRAAIAFVATRARRDACATHLGPFRFRFYVNDVGLSAMHAGDMLTAREYLSLAARHHSDDGDLGNLTISLQNLTTCLGHLGETSAARGAADQAVSCAESTGDRKLLRDSRAYLAWLATLAGDTAEAEQQFTAADQVASDDDANDDHLYSVAGNQWADWLARTGRPDPARALTERNREICQVLGWKDDLASCDRMLGRLALAAGDSAKAGGFFAAAAKYFRDGDYLTELAITLIDLAEHACVTGDIEAAERHATEAITIADPRGLVPAQSAALAARARIFASQALTAPDPDHVVQGRGAADAALRLAARHHLAWQELDALRAHASLDRAEGTDAGWAAKADALHARLVPADLDPDPLTTAKLHLARQKVARRETTGWYARSLGSSLPAAAESALEGIVGETLDLRDVSGIMNAAGDKIADRWRERPPGLAAVIGLSPSGPFEIDIVRQGPHALIIGATSSGKTELLRTLISALAAAYPPDRVTFLIAGQSSAQEFGELLQLPHTVGVLSDMDDRLAQRAQRSLEAEILRREQIFVRAGTTNIDDYAAAQGQDAKLPPVPRFLLILDEFTAIAQESSLFSVLLSIANRGRSVGMHLVLATQLVPEKLLEQIGPPVRLRIALQVTSAEHSVKVIGTSAAAGILAATPGRGYARLGPDVLTPFQTAWAGRHPKSLVQGVRDAARQLGTPRPHRPLLPPLPDLLRLDDLPGPSPGRDLAPVVYGLEDVPAEQAYRPAELDLAGPAHLLIAGDRGSGRSQFLRTLAAALAMQHSCADVHLYGIDLADGALEVLTDLPHCGAVVTTAPTTRTIRLLNRLTAEMHRRQEIMAEAGFANINEQRLAVSGRRQLPHVLLLIDGYEHFTAALGEVQDGRLAEQLTDLLNDGGRVGIHLALAGDHRLLHESFSPTISEKLLLPLSDHGELSSIGARGNTAPTAWSPGRALRGDSGLEVQVAILDGEPTDSGQQAALTVLATAVRARDAAVPLAQRPFRVDEVSLVADRFHVGDAQGRAVGRDDVLAWLRDRYATRGSAALLGPRRAGKSWVLAELSRLLRASGVTSVHELVVPMPSSRVETADVLATILDHSVAQKISPATALLDKARRAADGPEPVIFLLDEVGRLAKYDPAAVSWLRDVGQAGAWLVYTGTEKDWHTVVRWALTVPGSSFGNDVNARDLGPWEEATALTFLYGTAANLGVDLTPDEIGKEIIDLVGTWPFYIQVVGDAVVRAVQGGDVSPLVDRSSLRRLVERRLIDEWTDHFKGRWAEIDTAGRSALLTQPKPPPSPQTLAPAQRNDLRDVGLLRQGEQWLADPPFFAWVTRNAASLHDRGM